MVDDPDCDLTDLAPSERFLGRVADYVRSRPGYPVAAVDALMEGLPTPAVAVDVGAGTGISTQLLADRGCRVIAVEPNAEMRAVAEQDRRFDCRDASAEETGLEQQSVDLVLCAQSFHWFRPDDALREFARILKPGGRLCLMWNKRDTTDSLTAGYCQAIVDIEGEDPAEQRMFDPAIIAGTVDFTEPQHRDFANCQSLDRDGLIGRAMSASYVPKIGSRADQLVGRLSTLFEQHVDSSGHVTMRYVTEVYLSDRR